MTEPSDKKTVGDAAHVMVKSALSVVPGFGGPLVELFQSIVAPPLEKRRAEWMASVAERLDQLEANGLNLQELQDNDQFISSAMHAAHIAIRTHNAEKLYALKNAVLNVAVGNNRDENQQSLFLSWIDDFSPLHLRLLKFFQSPPQNPGISMGGLWHVLERSLPDLADQRELVNLIWRDLNLNGLTNTDHLNVMMSAEGLKASRTTELANLFLKFIEDPQNAL